MFDSVALLSSSYSVGYFSLKSPNYHDLSLLELSRAALMDATLEFEALGG